MVAPVLFTVLFGTFQLGWAYHCASTVQFALERGSRILMINANANASDVETAMNHYISQAAGVDFDVALQQVTVNGNPFTRATATYHHTVDIPFVPTFDLNFTSVQVVQRPT